MGDLLSLVGDIYEAALETELWPSVLEKIADMANGTTTVLSVHQPSTRWGTIMAGVRGNPELRAKYEQHYCRINPHAAVIAKLPVCGVGIGQSAISDKGLAQTEYYNDYLRPQDIFHIAGGVFEREGPLQYVYTTARPQRKGQFEEEELAFLKKVLPHLAQASRISRKLMASGQILQSFESLQIGLVLVDSRGFVVIANMQATDIFNQKDGLALSGAGEIITHPGSELTLRRPLLSAMLTSLGKGIGAGGDLLIERPSGKKPFRVSISPLHLSHTNGPFKNVAAAVFISDSERELSVNVDLLMNHYKATKAEAAVANLLAQGKDLDEVCEALGVRKTTGRTHLRSLMQKLGVNRQSELVLELARLMGPPLPL